MPYPRSENIYSAVRTDAGKYRKQGLSSVWNRCSEKFIIKLRKNPEISSDVRLFINDDDCPNAFATGRRTVCVTRGLLTWSDAEIKAALGHEFGHLAHKDTDRILVVAIGNTVIAGICYMFQIAAIIMDVIIAISSLFMRSDSGFWVRIPRIFA
ncbi:MAG: M48 family metalloprotease [Mediterraneibacter sp.]